MEINKLYEENCLITMGRMADGFLDLTVTSPPYDKLRKYKDSEWGECVWKSIIKELYRVTKDGGVVVWIVNDQVINGSESGTSFRQALNFIDNGWRLYDTMIYKKLNPPPNSNNRYQQCFEYIFVFSKGKPRTTNIKLRKRRNKCNDKRTFRKKNFTRNKDGKFKKVNYHVKEFVPKENIFEYYVGSGNSTKDKIAFKHPAIFPEKLAEDQILSWSNENDIVYDPLAGSGTTLKMSILNNRNCIISERVPEYCEIIKERILNI